MEPEHEVQSLPAGATDVFGDSGLLQFACLVGQPEMEKTQLAADQCCLTVGRAFILTVGAADD